MSAAARVSALELENRKLRWLILVSLSVSSRKGVSGDQLCAVVQSLFAHVCKLQVDTCLTWLERGGFVEVRRKRLGRAEPRGQKDSHVSQETYLAVLKPDGKAVVDYSQACPVGVSRPALEAMTQGPDRMTW